MKILSRQDLKNQLKRKEYAPVYLLFGSEFYLRDLAARTIAELVLKDSSIREFNETEISLNTSEIKDALATAEQIPMIDARRVVVVTNVIVSATKSKDTLREDDDVFLRDYLQNPAETTILIFIADELDKRRKISKLLIEHSCSVEFKPLDDAALILWAKDKLREIGAVADDTVLRRLVELTGNDARKLTIEIEKLATATLPDSVITDEVVETLTSNSRALSNFELTDHLLARSKSQSLKVMKKILDDGAEPVMLLGLLSYNFHRLFLAKEMMTDGMDRKEISRVMRLPYNRQQSFLETARRTSRDKFSRILRRIAETDLAIKTSIGTPRLQIEMLICELAVF